MPIYEYACARCGETIEAIQRFSDAPLKKHEGCGGALEKLISVPSFQVKGSVGYDSNTLDTVRRADENLRVASDKKKKKPASVVSVPSASKPSRKPRK